jgi:hypothetical protein
MILILAKIVEAGSGSLDVQRMADLLARLSGNGWQLADQLRHGRREARRGRFAKQKPSCVEDLAA